MKKKYFLTHNPNVDGVIHSEVVTGFNQKWYEHSIGKPIYWKRKEFEKDGKKCIVIKIKPYGFNNTYEGLVPMSKVIYKEEK